MLWTFPKRTRTRYYSMQMTCCTYDWFKGFFLQPPEKHLWALHLLCLVVNSTLLSWRVCASQPIIFGENYHWNCSIQNNLKLREKMWNFCMLDKSGQQLYVGMFVYICSPWARCFHAARLADLSSFQRPVGRENIQPSQELRLTQERFNSAGSPPQPATVLYTLSNEGQLLLVGTLVRTLYVLFLLRWRVELWKKRQTWSRIPPESFQQAIKYTLVTIETGWCGRH